MGGAAAWRRPAVLVPASAGVAALIVAAAVIRPVRTALIGSDAAASVLYFQRIASGETLERFLGTTPKPLLTVIDGLLYTSTHDWRPIAWLALVVYALAIAAAAALAVRTSGTVAGVFVGAALIACWGLLQDAALAYAVSWALLAVSAAGLFLTASTPRYGLAGTALALGALARQEVLIVAVVAAIVVAVTWSTEGSEGHRARGRWLLLIGLAAVPLTMLHDVLLAADPLYTLRVSGLVAEGQDTGGLSAAVRALAGHGFGNIPLLLLAAIGAIALARRSAGTVLIGASSVVVGVSLVVLFVGLRGLVVLDRYALPVELALIFLAGAGVAAIRVPELAVSAGPRAAVLAVAALVGLGIGPRFGPLDEPTTDRIRIEAQAGRDYGQILPELAAAVAARPGLRAPSGAADPTSGRLSGPVLYVTPRLLVFVLVDLDLQLDHVARLSQLDLAKPSPTSPADSGTLALHFRRVETQAGAVWSEVDKTVTYPGLVVSPIAQIEDRVWLVRLDRH